jgi:hypothetical protein
MSVNPPTRMFTKSMLKLSCQSPHNAIRIFMKSADSYRVFQQPQAKSLIERVPVESSATRRF